MIIHAVIKIFYFLQYQNYYIYYNIKIIIFTTSKLLYMYITMYSYHFNLF